MELIILLSLVAILDYYGYQAFKTVGGKHKWVKWAYLGVHFIVYGCMMVLIANGRDTPRAFATTFFSVWVTLYLPKIFIAIPLIGEDIYRIYGWIRKKLPSFNNSSEDLTNGEIISREVIPGSPTDTAITTNKISRKKFISQLALGAASVPFIGTLYGVTLGKYDYRVRRVKVPIKDLPKSFEGLTITHISDIHTGSFENKAAVWRGIEMINEQNSDLIFFTGDLVNSRIDEVKEYEDIFSALTAPQGVYSSLGNHDYGNYEDWSSDQEKKDHFKKLTDKHGEFGWNLLMNENHQIVRGEDRLAILGVENWGKSRYFPKKGDLTKASQGVENAHVKLLLSHDPTHWSEQVRKDFKDIDVTFSGHTHGFQFGVEIPGVKWSPAQYMYKHWAGLYEEENQYLYVNRGFGYLGFSGRIGIWPEITVVELVNQA